MPTSLRRFISVSPTSTLSPRLTLIIQTNRWQGERDRRVEQRQGRPSDNTGSPRRTDHLRRGGFHRYGYGHRNQDFERQVESTSDCARVDLISVNSGQCQSHRGVEQGSTHYHARPTGKGKYRRLWRGYVCRCCYKQVRLGCFLTITEDLSVIVLF